MKGERTGKGEEERSRIRMRSSQASEGGSSGSIAAGVDDLATGHGREGAPGAGVEVALEDLARAVENPTFTPPEWRELAPIMVRSVILWTLPVPSLENKHAVLFGPCKWL